MISIDTKKSLYKPIEIEIDGKIFQVKRIPRDVLLKIERLGEEALKGNVVAGYQQLELLIGKSEYVDRLDIREVNEIIGFITEKIYKLEKTETEEEKNESKPGLIKSG